MTRNFGPNIKDLKKSSRTVRHKRQLQGLLCDLLIADRLGNIIQLAKGVVPAPKEQSYAIERDQRRGAIQRRI